MACMLLIELPDGDTMLAADVNEPDGSSIFATDSHSRMATKQKIDNVTKRYRPMMKSQYETAHPDQQNTRGISTNCSCVLCANLGTFGCLAPWLLQDVGR